MMLSDLSVRRPVLAAVLSLLLIAFGAVAFNLLPLREFLGMVGAWEWQQRGIALPQLAGEVRKLQGTAAEAGTPADAVPVVISADKDIKYDTVVKTMDTLKRAGVDRVGLAVQASR